MKKRRSLLLVLPVALFLAACDDNTRASSKSMGPDSNALFPGESHEVHGLINKYADNYQVPRSLVHRIVQRESGYNPTAKNGPYMGLMQIDPRTATRMGFDGTPRDLLNPDTNLKYAVKYLRGAWLVSDGDEGKAVGWYSRGYYYEAKRRGLLNVAGM